MSFALIKANLIERQRVEFDKRHMEYFINEL
jgi:DNA-binding MarR family transcriptional regulator